jgi:hypothetical protein
LDEAGADVVEAAPVRHRRGDELGAVVEANEARRAAGHGEAVQGGDDPVSVDGAVHDDGRALAGVLVDDVQELEGSAVDGDVELEVQRPQGVRADRAHRADCGADPAVRSLALPIGHSEALVAPEPLDPFVVHRPALAAGCLGRPAPSPSRSGPQRTLVARPAAAPRPQSAPVGRAVGSIGAGQRPDMRAVGRPRTARAASQRRGGDGSGSEVSLRDLLEHRLVQLGLGQELLQSGVLDLELAEPLGVVGLHPAVLGDPAMPRRLRDL